MDGTAKYKVLWIPPKPQEWETYEDSLDRDEAIKKCNDLWEAGYHDARIEETPQSKTSAFLVSICKFAKQ